MSPKAVSAPFEERAKRIALVISDVDGVLTDAGVFVGPEGEVMKRFSVRDGMGVARLRARGIETAFMTGENSPAVAQRAKKLQLEHVCLGIKDKRGELDRLLAATGLAPEQIAYIGDDVNDLEVMRFVREVGLTGTPNDAESPIVAVAHHRCERRGGYGAFREFAEWILRLRGDEETDGTR